MVGHLTTRKFVEEWGLGENSFAVDPPNAVISFVEKGDETPEDAIVVLKDPVLESDSLTYTVEMLEGNLPTKGELVSVFIDPFGVVRSRRTRWPASTGASGGAVPAEKTVIAGRAPASKTRRGGLSAAPSRFGARRLLRSLVPHRLTVGYAPRLHKMRYPAVTVRSRQRRPVPTRTRESASAVRE